MRRTLPALLALLGLLSLSFVPVTLARPAAADLTLYADALAAGWVETGWSWDTAVNLSNANPVHGGASSISAQYTAAWGGLYVHSDPATATSVYTKLRFWVHGGATGNHAIALSINFDVAHTVAVTTTANTWLMKEVSLAALGNPASISDVVWQDSSGGAQPAFYLDDIVLVADTTPPPALALSVDATADQHAISPDIYGMNFASDAVIAALNIPVRRWGGNHTSRYNWQNNITNHASDWYFENIPEDVTADQFITNTHAAGAQVLLTVPTIGWVAKNWTTPNNGYDCGFNTVKYNYAPGPLYPGDPGHDTANPASINCGTGKRDTGTFVTGNDPADTSIAITGTFAANWVNHLTTLFGAANGGGVKFYNLDNEPGLWSETHRDVHPQPFTYDEAYTRTVIYAAAIKAADPSALVAGPAQDGWTRYWYASYPSQAQAEADRNAHGGVYFIPWYLQQLKAYEDANHIRLLDYLDLHYYPQASGVSLSPAGNAATQALRLRTTRSLWDATYVDESWIGGAGPDGGIVKLIPRMKAWVNTYYPGTKLAIGEYNWGALDDMNGALTQADVLGLFGREGMDLATLWSPPTLTQPGAFAFRIYRNYDGAGGVFGNTNVRAVSTDQSQLAVYAARRASDAALTLVIINKTAGDLNTPLTLANYTPGLTAQVYRYSAANLSAIVHLPDMAVMPGSFTTTYPANSITLIIIPPASGTYHWLYLPLVTR